jgi:hypothetical protein
VGPERSSALEGVATNRGTSRGTPPVIIAAPRTSGRYHPPMPTFDELDALPSKELHDRAVKIAEHRLDLAFFWHLLEYAPLAEAVSGDVDEARGDVAHVSAQVHDAVHSDDGKLADALRPLYIDYLLKHEHDAHG